MNSQQEKAFKYIHNVSDGYKRILPVREDRVVLTHDLNDYYMFYKDLREKSQPDWSGWQEISRLVSLFPSERAAFGKTWLHKDIENMVFAAYEKIWNDKEIDEYPSAFNMDIQMFDAYLFSPNCFESVWKVIDSTNNNAALECSKNPVKYNEIIKSAKMAYIRKIALPEWNVRQDVSQESPKHKWYDRINIIQQL